MGQAVRLGTLGSGSVSMRLAAYASRGGFLVILCGFLLADVIPARSAGWNVLCDSGVKYHSTTEPAYKSSSKHVLIFDKSKDNSMVFRQIESVIFDHEYGRPLLKRDSQINYFPRERMFLRIASRDFSRRLNPNLCDKPKRPTVINYVHMVLMASTVAAIGKLPWAGLCENPSLNVIPRGLDLLPGYPRRLSGNLHRAYRDRERSSEILSLFICCFPKPIGGIAQPVGCAPERDCKGHDEQRGDSTNRAAIFIQKGAQARTITDKDRESGGTFLRGLSSVLVFLLAYALYKRFGAGKKPNKKNDD